MSRPGARAVALLLLIAAASGCSPLIGSRSASLNYFLLTPSLPADPAPSMMPASARPFYVVAPPRLPEYLQQRPMVARVGENELALFGNDQWAAPLEDNTAAVLAQSLSGLLGTDRVLLQPVPLGVPVDYEIRLDISRFERQPDGHVVFAGRWSVFSDGGRTLQAMRSFNLRSAEAAAGPQAIAGSMSALLGEVAGDIAATLRSSPPQSAGRPLG